MTALVPSHNPWMTRAQTRAVMAALTSDGGEARFVGGAVRNALLGVPVTDVDIATTLLPGEVMRRLQGAGLGAVPTGIEHGTVTAIADKIPYEVTTLRRDVLTDGRRAVVAFTTDWKEDASRRDFTMNALYADERGEIYDYFGGIADLRMGRVRFIGDAVTRIREDYLRILRLFRFHAWYGKGDIDATALAAATAEKDGIATLSGERIQKEILRLLEAKDPFPTVLEMTSVGVMAKVVPDADIGSLQRLIGIERELHLPPDALLRLAGLMSNRDTAMDAARDMRFSKADATRVIAAMQRATELDGKPPRVLLYNMGVSGFRDALLLRWAREPVRAEQWRAMESLSRHWTPPVFPLRGDDVKALGITEGPKVGRLLGDLEEEWKRDDFQYGREELLARLKAAVEAG